jgi:maltose O-acetyltransferase
LDPKRLWSDGKAVLAARYYLRSAERLGSRVRVWGHPVVANSGRLIVGDRVRLVSTVAKLEIAVEHGAELEIGERAFINYGCSIGATQRVRIGPRCTIGTHVIMMDNDFHRLEPDRRDERPPSAPIELEENVWLGARVIVLRGVTIGANSVIGAGSVVSQNVPGGVIAAGVPAKVLRAL